MIDLTLSEYDQFLFLSTISNIIDMIIICSKAKSYKSKLLKKKLVNIQYNIDDSGVANAGLIIHSLVDKITTIVIKKQYRADKLCVNMCTLTDILMIIVNKYTYLTNIEKKMIVLQALDKFIRERLEFIIDLPVDKKENLINSIDAIPITIDLFIALQNGTYNINRKVIIQDTNKKWYSFFQKKKKKDNDD